MAKAKDTSMRAKIIAVMETKPDAWLTVEDVGSMGEWTEHERKNLGVNMAMMSTARILDRVKSERQGEIKTSQRRNVYIHRIARAKPETDNLVKRRAIATDPASRALSSPPRGDGQRVASRDSSSHGGKRPAPLFPMGDAPTLALPSSITGPVKMIYTPPDPITERLDEMSDLFDHWKKWRAKNHTPAGIRTALVILAEEIVAMKGVA